MEKKGENSIDLRGKILGSWDSYLSIFQDNLIFNKLRHLKSSNDITIKIASKIDYAKKTAVLFNAHIESDNFLLSRNSDNTNVSPFSINKGWIVSKMEERLSSNSDYACKYVLFEGIPINLINAIICTEDPNFWQHKGIDPYFIGYAISANIEKKRFERGASTISMQLVRNLLLNHDKNIIRKIEECIITLLFENYYKISKKDIFEIYVNIIEFAPGIRGIYNASLFYFGKSYVELSLTECLILTYVIPRPKHFYEAFLLKSQQLYDSLYNHLNQFSRVMLMKGLITVEEHSNMNYDIVSLFRKTESQ